MELTPERVDELLAHSAKIGKQEREKIGYSGEFLPVANVVGPRCEEAVLPLYHRTNVQKHIVMRALSAAARAQGAIAIVIVSDARWAHADKFGDYFHIPRMEEIGVDAWGEQYREILDGTYGGTLENCPREVWDEALSVSIKGPAIPHRGLLYPYEKGPRDTVVWREGDDIKDKDETMAKIEVLPDWWDEPTGRPA